MIQLCKGPGKSDIQLLMLFFILLQIAISVVGYLLYKKNLFKIESKGWRVFVGILIFLTVSAIPLFLIALGGSILSSYNE